jgi:hypothetical protein
MDTTTGMSAPPIGTIINTPSFIFAAELAEGHDRAAESDRAAEGDRRPAPVRCRCRCGPVNDHAAGLHAAHPVLGDEHPQPDGCGISAVETAASAAATRWAASTFYRPSRLGWPGPMFQYNHPTALWESFSNAASDFCSLTKIIINAMYYPSAGVSTQNPYRVCWRCSCH